MTRHLWLLPILLLLAGWWGIIASNAATPVTQDIQISWTASAPNPATGYRVERKIGAGGTYAQVGADLSAATLSYIDKNLTFGTNYCYRVTGLGAAGNSAPTPDACVSTAGIPSVPGSVTVNVIVNPATP